MRFHAPRNVGATLQLHPARKVGSSPRSHVSNPCGWETPGTSLPVHSKGPNAQLVSAKFSGQRERGYGAQQVAECPTSHTKVHSAGRRGMWPRASKRTVGCWGAPWAPATAARLEGQCRCGLGGKSTDHDEQAVRGVCSPAFPPAVQPMGGFWQACLTGSGMLLTIVVGVGNTQVNCVAAVAPSWHCAGSAYCLPALC